MVHMRALHLEGTGVSDLLPLTFLTSLLYLNLKGTPITNIRALSTMRSLRFLDLQFTEVNDFRPVSARLAQPHAFKLVINKSSRADETGSMEECAICQGEIDYEDATTPLTATACGHIYHGECLATWFTHRKSCPTCRVAQTTRVRENL